METRIVILITYYVAAARRAFYNVVASIVLMAGVNVITTSATGQGVNDRYYRFEEGVAGNCASGAGSIVDSYFGSPDGTPDGCPVYSADVPFAVIPLTGQPDTLSLSFSGAQSILFDSFFLLHRTFGDATLEYFIKVPTDVPHASIFWTRPTTLPDENRFNLYILRGGALQGDYREPDGSIHRPLGGGAELVNQWHHVALVKDTQTQAPAHIYNAYVDGVKTLSTVDGHPNEPDPDLMWTISGRVGAQFTGLLDEVRLTQRALAPCDFLISASPCSSPSPTPTPTATVTPSSTPRPSPTPRFHPTPRPRPTPPPRP
jgi:Concanavalin A-like lectin/glucanases superfamily